ncbi:MAG TPA: hypothetical protein VF041_07305 [Gemmatimonadaceae bacterium]
MTTSEDDIHALTPEGIGSEPGDYLSSARGHGDAARVVRAIEAAQRTHAFASPELRDAIARYARSARDAGLPPERLIVGVKVLVRDVALPEMRDWFRGVLTDRAVAWAIEAYYELDEP